MCAPRYFAPHTDEHNDGDWRRPFGGFDASHRLVTCASWTSAYFSPPGQRDYEVAHWTAGVIVCHVVRQGASCTSTTSRRAARRASPRSRRGSRSGHGAAPPSCTSPAGALFAAAAAAAAVVIFVAAAAAAVVVVVIIIVVVAVVVIEGGFSWSSVFPPPPSAVRNWVSTANGLVRVFWWTRRPSSSPDWVGVLCVCDQHRALPRPSPGRRRDRTTDWRCRHEGVAAIDTKVAISRCCDFTRTMSRVLDDDESPSCLIAAIGTAEWLLATWLDADARRCGWFVLLTPAEQR